MVRAVLVAAIVAMLTGCGSELEAEDPDGYEACVALRDALAEDASTKERLGGLLKAGEHARTATTPDIRRAKEYLEGDVGVIADVDLMSKACDAAGVHVK